MADLQDPVRAWVTQLQQRGFAITPVGERLCDQPPGIKAAIALADPEGYFTQVWAERMAEAREAVAQLPAWGVKR